MSGIRQASGGRTSVSGRRLVDHLDSLVARGDLGALALLRRGLGRELGEMPEIFPHVLPYLLIPDSASSAQREREEDAALLVASLYALWHQGKSRPIAAERVSVGAAFQQMAKQLDSDNLERRFVTLLKTSRDQLPDHLRYAVSLMRASNVSLDWSLLYSDLCQWDYTDQRERHSVRRRWARDFWEHERDSEEQAGDVDSNNTDNTKDGLSEQDE